ncbi:hypothetical protein AMATHDRAFT_54945 [Amanita thiersii Skay4041]|uniref:Uncharacterized protein n=1 Tax=Amanita thiersii Skay4041 TaxID=703135 RepID=A0A2A9NZ11_9AGAR|nr:hypothetical protein AMATHDRAFT_54945 [Amanita thiersii Skay4041]
MSGSSKLPPKYHRIAPPMRFDIIGREHPHSPTSQGFSSPSPRPLPLFSHASWSYGWSPDYQLHAVGALCIMPSLVIITPPSCCELYGSTYLSLIAPSSRSPIDSFGKLWGLHCYR